MCLHDSRHFLILALARAVCSGQGDQSTVYCSQVMKKENVVIETPGRSRENKLHIDSYRDLELPVVESRKFMHYLYLSTVFLLSNGKCQSTLMNQNHLNHLLPFHA